MMSEHVERSSKQKLPPHQSPTSHQQFETQIDAAEFSRINPEAPSLKSDELLWLQRTVGNRALQRLLTTDRTRSLSASTTLTQPAPRPARAMRDRLLAHAYSPADTSQITSASPALRMRGTLQTLPTTHHIQRDIKGSHKFPTGKLEIDFQKNEGAAVGDTASESGTITFTPSKSAPKSSAIHMIQIVRTTDKSGPTETDYVWPGAEAPRNDMMTGRDYAKNIAPGWFVDQVAGELKKRTKKSDPEQKPYYDQTFTTPRPGQNQIGATGDPPTPATLDDAPGDSAPGRFLFNTSVKGDDNGVFYGTVLWGFEIYHDKAGVSKIKGEYKRFRSYPGETLNAAVEKFNEYYQNPGTTNAPTT
jgi:hypothetical protein